MTEIPFLEAAINLGVPIALLFYLLRFTQTDLQQMKIDLIKIKLYLAFIMSELGVKPPSDQGD